MAKIIYTAVVSELNGSIGGITFQKNSSGTIAKLKSKQTVNPSTQQSISQLNFSRCVNKWGSLSLADKSSWDSLIVYPNSNPWGIPKILNGFQWFVSLNLNRIIIGVETFLTTAPSYSLPAPPPVISIVYSAGFVNLHFASSVDLVDNFILVYMTPPLRSNTIKTRTNILLVSQASGGPFTDLDVTWVFTYRFHLDVDLFFADSRASFITSCCIVNSVTGFKSSFSRVVTQVGA